MGWVAMGFLGRSWSLASTSLLKQAVESLTAVSISDTKLVLEYDLSAVTDFVRFGYSGWACGGYTMFHLTFGIAHGSELDFRTALACTSWYD